MDPRVQKLAKLLIHYSLKLKSGQLIKMTGEPVTLPLLLAAYQEAVEVGAYPVLELRPPEADEILLKHGSDKQLSYISPMGKTEINRIDAFLMVWGSQNTKFLSKVDPKRQALRQKSRRPYMMRFFKRVAEGSLKWVGTQFPTEADAQDAGMSLRDYEDFVYRAGHLHSADPVKHWKQVEKQQQRLVRILNKVDRIHVKAPDTDLHLRVKGRKWISCHGDQNFPDGEIFTSPLETSVEGHIRFSFPATYGGREVEDVRLEFRKGRVVKATAARNQEYLLAMLDMDKGARTVGEFAIGTNYDIKQASKNILFDEKIGGTCHLAVGASIPESGGRNQSALHWDMVCDLKRRATITADDKVIYRNGKFVI